MHGKWHGQLLHDWEMSCYEYHCRNNFIHTESTFTDHVMSNIWSLRKIDREYLESFEIYYWMKVAEDRLDLSCEVWHGVKEERNILHKIKERKANQIGHSLRRTALKIKFLKEIWNTNNEIREDEKQNVSSYSMALRTKDIIGIWYKKHKMAPLDTSLW